ncbi:MAG: hypothetical protein QOF92_1537 [Pseudonocardiales bacterium]|nr:hypothetical protein [Pseudonocardiales bacterium]
MDEASPTGRSQQLPGSIAPTQVLDPAEVTDPTEVLPPVSVLGPITLGLGAADGYSGTDITSPRAAAAAGEVPYLAADGSTPGADPVVELRIHGIGGAPSTENLQTPTTVQVAGDGTAGFHRAWFPGGSAQGRPRREAYCWGGLNTRATSRALWLLLVAFMLVNVAHWALPGRRTKREAAANGISRACLRLLGLALTVAFVATTITVLGDLLAWQAPGRNVLPTWLGWYSERAIGPRLAMSLLAVMAVIGVLAAVSVQTSKSYEKWGAAAHTDADPDWPLTEPSFWRGERVVQRQRNCHLAAACALVLLFAALPHSAANPLRILLLVLAGVIGGVAIALIASPWTDRIRIAGSAERWSDAVCRWFALGAAALAVGTSVARFWWRVQVDARALPADQVLQVWSVFAEFAIVLVLLIAVVVQAPWRAGREVMGFGLAAPLLAALGCMVATIFGSSLTLAVANLIGTPKVTTADGGVGRKTLLLPSTVYAGGAGMVVAVLMVVGISIYALSWVKWEGDRLARTGDNQDPDSVLNSYPEPGGDDSVRQVGKTWARASLTDHASSALTVITVPTVALLVAYLICLQAGVESSFLAKVAQIGGTIGVAATLYFLALLRSALTNSSARKRFGALWDIGTFWPRACHPLGPPCYAERTIPEVVTRVRRIVGDRVRAPGDPALAQEDAERRNHGAPMEAHSPVLLTGYSQGTPIAVAVLAQLPQEVRARMSLLLLAAPVRRLYGRAFPAYFGPEQLARLRAHLTDNEVVRWRTLVRRSDYVGGCAFEPKRNAAEHGFVDRIIYDPPVLWSDKDPSPPPTHRHSDLFPDPQVSPYAAELARLLEVGGAAAGPAPERDRTG